MNRLIIDGYSLTLKQISAFIEDPSMQVAISPEAEERVIRSRQQIDKLVKKAGKLVYGIHTGLGKLKDYRIEDADQETFQRNILYSHATGVGPYFEDAIARLAMLLRANVFCRGNSGVRLELIQRLVDFINHGLYPQMRQLGSLGVGDLQPMAQMGLCLSAMPEGEIKFQGEIASAPVMLERAGLPVPFPFARREALALMSGSTALLAVAILSYYRAKKSLSISDMALSLSLEAFRGELDAYDERIHRARGIQGQVETATHVMALTAGSQFLGEEGKAFLEDGMPRIQDPVSFRSSPQIHGAARDVLVYLKTILTRELNASTDNPLFFENKEGEYESLSGGNFHGALLSYGMDMLGIILTDLAVLSERRSARLLDPYLSYGLPCNLIGDNLGLNTGFALIQANATAIVGEMRVLAAPASVGSISSKNNQEDHNSMGMGAARKTLHLLEHLEIVLSIEFLCAAQGIDLVHSKAHALKLGVGTREIHQRIRNAIAPVLADRYCGDLIDKMQLLIRGQELTEIFHRLCLPEEPLLTYSI